MGTECIQAQRNRSHILRMLPDDSEVSSCSSNSGKIRKDVSCSIMDNDKSIKSLRHRPRKNNSQFDNNSEEEDSDCMHFEEVEVRWIPEGACRHTLDEALVFYPTEEEFEDPLNYINNIRPRAEPFGIWCIIPPSSWKPPCFLKEKRLWQNLKISTRVQQIDKLQNRETLKGTSIRRRKSQKVLKIWGNSDEINLGLKLVRISH